MKSLKHLSQRSIGMPVTSDEVLEHHASRLLLLISVCGTRSRTSSLARVEGLTKLAKLDFFTRYPAFFRRVAEHLGRTAEGHLDTIESKMVRYHYGPWDHRYYQVLPYLEARDLLAVRKVGNQYQFEVTEKGQQIANQLLEQPAFAPLTTHMRDVRRLLGAKSGEALKRLVYEVFQKEVADAEMGAEIVE